MFAFGSKAAGLAYQPSRWQRYLWGQRTDLTSVRKAVGAVRQAMTEREIAHGDEEGEILDEGTAFGGEVYARLYGDPERVEEPVRWAESAMQIVEGLDGWRTLRESVAGDPDFSALATAQVLEALAPQLAELAREDADREERSEPLPAGDPSETAAGAALRAAARRALSSASDTVAKGREALTGIAPGLADAPATHEQRDPRRARLAERIMRDLRVQDVLRKAGRLQRLAERQNKVTDPHGVSTVVGVETGGDLGRMLPTEAMRLLDEDMEALFAARLAERGLMQLRTSDKAPLSNGPMVVLVDESGSMDGHGELWAHAAVVAMIGRATRDRRSCAVVTFNAQITGAWEVSQDGSCSRMNTREPVPEGTRLPVEQVILEMLSRRSDGGTRFAPAMAWASRYLKGRERRADVVLVTDGEAGMPRELVEAYEEILAAEGRIFGVTVNGGSVSSTLRKMCTVVVDVDHAKDLEKEIARAVPVRAA